MKLMNQKKRSKDNQVEPDPKRAKKMSGKQKQGNTCKPPQRKKQLGKLRNRAQEKKTARHRNKRRRLLQKRQAKRRQKEEEERC